MNHRTISDIRGMNMAARDARPPRVECQHAITDTVTRNSAPDILAVLFGMLPRPRRYVVCCDCGKYMGPAQ